MLIVLTGACPASRSCGPELTPYRPVTAESSLATSGPGSLCTGQMDKLRTYILHGKGPLAETTPRIPAAVNTATMIVQFNG